MNATALQVDRAEDISSRLEEALRYMRSAAEELEMVADDLNDDIISTLRELISSAEIEKQDFDEILGDAEKQELSAMNREYERSVF